jgi:hypothetical protein
MARCARTESECALLPAAAGAVASAQSDVGADAVAQHGEHVRRQCRRRHDDAHVPLGTNHFAVPRQRRAIPDSVAGALVKRPPANQTALAGRNRQAPAQRNVGGGQHSIVQTHIGNETHVASFRVARLLERLDANLQRVLARGERTAHLGDFPQHTVAVYTRLLSVFRVSDDQIRPLVQWSSPFRMNPFPTS